MRIRCGDLLASFPAQGLRMILPFEEPQPVPRMRAGVAGVIVRQSRVIPVFELSALVPGIAPGARNRTAAASIAVVEHEGALAGFLVESIEPAHQPPTESDAIPDGIRLLATAGIFSDPPGDEPAADAASGAI